MVGTPGTAWKDIETSSPPLPVCRSDWLRAKSESNLICLLSGPHVSWPMTHHLDVVILQQWCCDLALPQSSSSVLTSSCKGLCVGKKKGDRRANLCFVVLFFSDWSCVFSFHDFVAPVPQVITQDLNRHHFLHWIHFQLNLEKHVLIWDR